MRKIILFVIMMICTSICAKTIKLDDKTCDKVVIYADSVKQASGEYMKIYYAVWDNNFIYESDEKTYNYYIMCKELNIRPKYVIIDDNWVVKQQGVIFFLNLFSFDSIARESSTIFYYNADGNHNDCNAASVVH